MGVNKDLDEAKEKLLKVKKSFGERKAALLHKAFTGELTGKWRERNGVGIESWENVTLQEISSVIGDGLHGTPIYDKHGEYFFINGNNFFYDHIEFKNDTKKVNEQEYQKYKTTLSKENTVFLSINGTLGRTAFYNDEKIILGKSACYINVLPKLNKHFLKHYLNTLDFIKYANEKATGSTIKNLGLKAMRMMPINLPTLPEQKEIVRILDEVFFAEKEAEKKVDTVLNDIDLIKKSILARAFRGKLNTNDAREPAAVL